MQYSYQDLAKMIDHSMLNPNMPVSDFDRGIELAISYDVASVCIMPFYLKRCAELLSGTDVKASTVIGFPHGGQTTATKRAEAQQAIAEGCEELDMVVNVNQVLSGNWDYVRSDIAAVIEVAHAADRKVKVIFENCYLQDEHKIKLCEICNDLGADWVKTSTGFGSSGATMEDLKLMRQHAADNVQVKAAGGVRDLDALIEVKKVGVTRCGSSRTPGMLDPLRRQLGMPEINSANSSAGANPNY
ncbi:Deoxyribose-phosphate aldolase 2 [Rubripirellula obstinata]|uniref:Deoxyribose-phosphate aldolase n=1 Tax=Rubripirellula obstinata TaxID=406547 RepID=A0A5B1CF76_9BACT|nr:deoxyribose-phosphate aldolase [Rubripirellula obstinata]KAA1259837.1 Deoxyribose-phosphate aldolase 2 [Rubripirellula obstinata]